MLVVLAVSLGFAPSALATEGEPTIGSVSAANITEHGARLEAQINPEGAETSYEILFECQIASLEPGVGCGPGSEPVPGDAHGHGDIVAGSEDRTVGVTVTRLHPGYSYWYGVLATNAAGKTESLHHLLQTSPPGACPDGCPGGSREPYETHLEPWVSESIGNWGAGAPAREAERQAKAAKEQAEREAAARRADQPVVTPTSSPPPMVTGSVSLASTNVAVQSNGMALVKLNCLGIESCHGKLTLTARSTAKAKGSKKARAATIGTVSFTISGEETKMVRIKLDAAGRALLSSDHRRLDASLEVLELAPSPENTQTKAVRLVWRTVSKGSGASARAVEIAGDVLHMYELVAGLRTDDGYRR